MRLLHILHITVTLHSPLQKKILSSYTLPVTHNCQWMIQQATHTMHLKLSSCPEACREL
jgi:hypothetical protein